MGINTPGGGSSPWTLLFDDTLSAADRFDVDGISQAHTELVLIASLRTDKAANSDTVSLLFNNDSAANYRNAQHYGGTVHSTVAAASTRLAQCPGATAVANHFGFLRIFVFNYASGQIKTARSISGSSNDATDIFAEDYFLRWSDTSAITRIQLQPGNYPTDEFVSGSQLQIWGFN